MSGLFLAFEGLDGSGKTCQSQNVMEWLARAGEDVIWCCDPGMTGVGSKIREILLHSEHALSPMTELLLFSAARSQLLSGVILPALAENKVVVCDRFIWSTIAYQAFGNGAPIDKVLQLLKLSVDRFPDAHILLDVPLEVSQSRRGYAQKDRFESRSTEFYRRVKQGYAINPNVDGGDSQHVYVIDAQADMDQVFEAVKEAVLKEYQARRRPVPWSAKTPDFSIA